MFFLDTAFFHLINLAYESSYLNENTNTSLFFYPEKSSVCLEVEFDSNSFVAQEHIDTEIKFGIDLGSLATPVEAKKYVLAFIQRLFLQREKLFLGQLTGYLESGILTLWQEVLSILENSNRKLLGVRCGSVIFTLFCPTLSSTRELRDDPWLKMLRQKMEQLMYKLGQ